MASRRSSPTTPPTFTPLTQNPWWAWARSGGCGTRTGTAPTGGSPSPPTFSPSTAPPRSCGPRSGTGIRLARSTATCGLSGCVTTAAATGSRSGLTGLDAPTPPATASDYSFSCRALEWRQMGTGGQPAHRAAPQRRALRASDIPIETPDRLIGITGMRSLTGLAVDRHGRLLQRLTACRAAHSIGAIRQSEGGSHDASKREPGAGGQCRLRPRRPQCPAELLRRGRPLAHPRPRTSRWPPRRHRSGDGGLLSKISELSGATARLELHDILANDNHTVTLATISAERAGKHYQDNLVQVAHVQNGKVTEIWRHRADADATG